MTFNLTLKLPCTLCLSPLPPVKKHQWRKMRTVLTFRKELISPVCASLGKSRLAASQAGWNHLELWHFPCHQNTYCSISQSAESMRVLKSCKDLYSLPDLVEQTPELISFIKVLHYILDGEVVCSWFLLCFGCSCCFVCFGFVSCSFFCFALFFKQVFLKTSLLVFHNSGSVSPLWELQGLRIWLIGWFYVWFIYLFIFLACFWLPRCWRLKGLGTLS